MKLDRYEDILMIEIISPRSVSVKLKPYSTDRGVDGVFMSTRNFEQSEVLLLLPIFGVVRVVVAVRTRIRPMFVRAPGTRNFDRRVVLRFHALRVDSLDDS
jgi:hypothetical protein